MGNATSGNGVAGDGRRPWLLGIDTATSRVVVAAASPDGTFLGATRWEAGHRHGEQLLPAIGRLHGELNLRRSRIAGIVVGTGPGAFTGLRVGIATAKALAHALGRPIVGVSSGEALIEAAADDAASGVAADDAASGVEATSGEAPAEPARIALLLPAGASDQIIVRTGQPPSLLPGGADPELAAGEILVAVDLDGRAPTDASARGDRARDGLAVAMMRLGGARFAAGDLDDLARLVPDYVTLPRGVRASSGEVAWSRDPR
jgi:tRNA threonylcarbamoyl adenosine modification protein YeaZ